MQTTWQKSTYSGGAEGNSCLELALSGEGMAIALRESDAPDEILVTTPATLARLIRQLKAN
ncbi:DUF397 domain-containing protein [Streptomyces sp. N2-109]|uniref:DUF397 domain-containing protein n=1 Tax=Streptomyces gossypii TaxID=2883101 RepID=A0ABT2JMI4_9ACTN|nr:DUF397 domain-containing protein [Streptomyces gossypii]MCT2589097.1 DUF397 domain-containing protein [Streptomyces gossypii]